MNEIINPNEQSRIVEVFLLAHTMPNWEVLTKACESEFGFDPAKKLAGTIYNNSLPAYMSVLRLDGTVGHWTPHPSWAHVSLSFITIMPIDLFTHFSSNTSFIQHMLKQGKNGTVVISSGSVLQWIEMVVHACSEEMDKEYRQLGNKVYSTFVRHRYENLFNDYTMKALRDGTFILEKK
jgi:hypothetical protein